ncbi:MAG TPA: SDR family oxidoreductase [Clostridia bacterium]|nr:SDR family oxidoreductase [Clostridia bacterium]
MDTQLKGRVVLVTGASGGIGAAIARGFAQEGANLVLHFRKGRRQTLALAKSLETEAIVLGADLTREEETRELFSAALAKFGRIDTLIANAASWEVQDTPLHQMTLKHWRRTQEGVLTSTFLTTREFLRAVARQKRGNAVLIASTAAVFGEANHADYAAAKAAIAFGLTRSLKNELARIAPHTRDYCGGRINCICPGWTVVPRLAAKLSDHAKIRAVTSTMALPQLGRPEDIAHAAVYLASDALARHVTGQTMVVAGGMEGRQLWSPEEIDAAAV